MSASSHVAHPSHEGHGSAGAAATRAPRARRTWQLAPEREWLLALVALALCAVPLVLDARQGSAGLLTAGFWGLLVCMGAMFFAAVNCVGGARWWRPVEGSTIAVGRGLIVPVFGVAVVIAVAIATAKPGADAPRVLYPWLTDPGEPLVMAKAAWLNPLAFVARAAGVVAVLLVCSTMLERTLKQRDVHKRARVGVLFILLAGFATMIAIWDWVMSLEPKWATTMYSWYNLGAALQGGVAATIVFTLLTSDPDESTRHDLGKYLFAFSMFWAYLWFCQFMLIWYANIPEEAAYYRYRMFGPWAGLFWANPIVTFAAPWLALLPVRTKLHRGALFTAAIVVLAGRWLDAYLLVGPSQSDPPEGGPELFYVLPAAVGMAIALVLWIRRTSQTPAEAAGDGA
ncbi:MAG: hypothetical protein IT373_06330 [Polyangiaceae bacterium]|nr:hypothetical protein [Polyangiaceae bacterium]